MTVRLWLVRHGRAEAGWDASVDPGLDERGRRQAREVARRLEPHGPLTILSSPLLRCQQTAEPLAKRWKTTAVVEPGVAEIPSPEGFEMAERVDWLRQAMRGTWADLGGRYTQFRDRVVATVLSLPTDSVIFSHFVAINAVIGAALGDDRLVIRSLDNTSVTTVEVSAAGRLSLIEGGREADTLIR